MNNLNDYGDSMRGPEYQAVLIVEYDDGRMFPLTEDIPKCLLPVGNRRLLSYQLDMLAKSGIAG
jgi:translation initiation factor eIF-2B subunit gamma